MIRNSVLDNNDQDHEKLFPKTRIAWPQHLITSKNPEPTKPNRSRLESRIVARSLGPVEREEPARVGPDLLVHDRAVRGVLTGQIHRDDAQPVVHAGHDLLLAARHLAEPEPVVGALDVLRHRPRADLLDVGVLDVGDDPPSPKVRRDGGGDGEGGGGSGNEEEAAGPHGFVMFEAGLDRAAFLWATTRCL
jgi:hypothetical protein